MFFFDRINNFLLIAFKLTFINPNTNWKVVGGEEAASGEFPFMVSLTYLGVHNCGGSIISDKWILCAAHCVYGYNVNDLKIVSGSNSLTEGGTQHEIEQTIVHEKYISNNVGYDISLIKLSSPIIFTNSTAPISLEKDDLDEVDVTLCGWGMDGFPGDVPDKLQKVRLRTITVQKCIDLVFFTNKNEICTQVPAGQGACFGDSGGPLIHNGKVCGIVSRGNPCAQGLPDIFTRVSVHVGWIEERIVKN